jgi:hypothetical protein
METIYDIGHDASYHHSPVFIFRMQRKPAATLRVAAGKVVGRCCAEA